MSMHIDPAIDSYWEGYLVGLEHVCAWLETVKQEQGTTIVQTGILCAQYQTAIRTELTKIPTNHGWIAPECRRDQGQALH